MTRKELEIKYKSLEKKCNDIKKELDELKNSRIIHIADKMPKKIRFWLYKCKTCKNTAEVENKDMQSTNNEVKEKRRFNIFGFLKSIVISFKNIITKLNTKHREMFFIKKYKTKFIKINDNINCDEKYIKEQVSIIIFSNKDCGAVYKILHQSYINFKIYLITEEENEKLSFLDSRIIIVSRADIDSNIFEYIEKNVKSEYVIVTDIDKTFDFNIKKSIKMLDKDFLIVSRKEFQKAVCFNNRSIENVKEYLKKQNINVGEK